LTRFAKDCALQDMMLLSLRHPEDLLFAYHRFRCRHEQRTVSFFRYSTANNVHTFEVSL
jgi:hypothetical protein